MPFFVRVFDYYNPSVTLFEGWSNDSLPSTSAANIVKKQKQACTCKVYASLFDKDKDNWLAYHQAVF